MSNYSNTTSLISESVNPVQQLLPYTPPPTYHVTFHQLTGAALVIGLSLFLVGIVLVSCLVLLLPGLRLYTTILYALVLVASSITAGSLTIRWNHELAVRAWRIEDEDRQRLIQSALTPSDPLTLPDQSRPDPDRLRLAGYNLLTLHYVHGLQATRPECETSLHMSQADWNRINHLLKLLKIKTERGWNDDIDHAAALLLWTSDVQITQDGDAMLRIAPGTWKRVEL